MSDVALFLISLAITVAGLLASWAAYRRSGAAAALRGTAWSLVPMAAYLTGLTRWLTGLVLDPVKWAGVVLAGLAVVLYLVSGAMLGRRSRRAVDRGREQAGRPGRKGVRDRTDGAGGTGGPHGAVEAPGQPAIDDLAQVEEILRRRGIT